MINNNDTLKFFEAQFEKAVQNKLDAERSTDSQKIEEAEKAAQDARDAVLKVKAQPEVTVEISADSGATHRKMSDGKRIQIKRGVIKDTERGARANPDVVRTRSNVRQKVRGDRSRT